MKKLKLILAVAAIGAFVASCGSTSETTSSKETISKQSQERNGGGKKDAASMLKQMDANGDGALSKEEVKGPIAENFSTIDTNSDGKITLEELKNAPRPKGGRPQRNN